MKKKETIFIIVFLIIITVAVGGYLIYKNIVQKQDNKITEYTPEEEISDEQLRKTIITVYYENKETGEIMPEARQVDVAVLAKNPYEYLINCLMENPKSEKLQNTIPTEAKINKIELKGDILFIDFSKEWIESIELGKEAEEKMINSIVKTMTELNEVNGIKVLVDGEEGKSFKDKGLSFKDIFYRKD